MTSVQVPDYADVVARPMDFSTMKSKLRDGLYTGYETFEADVRLLCANAMLYNAVETLYYKEAEKLLAGAEKHIEVYRQRWTQELAAERAKPHYDKAVSPALVRGSVVATAKPADGGSGTLAVGSAMEAAVVGDGSSATASSNVPLLPAAGTRKRKPGKPRGRPKSIKAKDAAAIGADGDADGQSGADAVTAANDDTAVAPDADGAAAPRKRRPGGATARRRNANRGAISGGPAVSFAASKAGADEAGVDDAALGDAGANGGMSESAGRPYRNGAAGYGGITLHSTSLFSGFSFAGQRVTLLPCDFDPVEDAWVCWVCDSGDAPEGNALMQCDAPGCGVVVHQLCYGLGDTLPAADQVCHVCSSLRLVLRRT